MKQCPYCAEDIKDEAIKCKHCGEMLGEVDRPVTEIVSTQWSERSVVLESDGSRRAFMDVIVEAVEVAGYPVTDRSYTDFRVCFESRGISWKSWSGDVISINLTETADGSRATLTAKGKPSGPIRLQAQASAML